MSENKKLYTFILNFNGGIYISQKVATSPKMALITWSESLDTKEIEGLGTKRKEKIMKEVEQENPTLIKGVDNVWCSMFLSGKSLAVLNFVQTEGNSP